MNRKYSLGVTITLMLVASALTCFVFLYNNGVLIRAFMNRNYVAGSDLGVLLKKIEDMYIGEYEVGEISDAAMRAAVDALGDRWSYYITQEEYDDFINSSNNQFVGIGIGAVVDEKTGGMAVAYAYRGSPAEIAGILAGDVIIEIDGQNLVGMDLGEMSDLLTRPLGQTAELTVFRADGTVEIIPVVYDLVFVDPIWFDILDDNIGYIGIANFDGGAADGFISAVDQLMELGVRALIFDVRGNGGGRVYEMTRMLDYLLPEGEVFISIDRNGNEEITWSDAWMIDVPAVVIVDRYSFSAAEYFPAILREYEYAQIVGEQTTGKSRSQRTEELPWGGALHISTSQYVTKNRVALFDVGGLTPDYQVTLSDDDMMLLYSGNLEIEDDLQLQRAIWVLNQK